MASVRPSPLNPMGTASGHSTAQCWKWHGFDLGSAHQLGRSRGSAEQLRNQFVGILMGTQTVGFKSQLGLLRYLSDKVLWIVTDVETTQSHHFHESIGGLFNGTLVFLGSFWRHVDLVLVEMIHPITTRQEGFRSTRYVLICYKFVKILNPADRPLAKQAVKRYPPVGASQSIISPAQ